MLGLCRHLELAHSRKTAIDVVIAGEFLNRVDRLVERSIELRRDVAAVARRHHAIVLRETVIAHSAVAAGRRIADSLGFADDDLRALLRKRERGRTSSK